MGSASDPQIPVVRALDGSIGDGYTYSMGKVFTFNHFVRPLRWWWKYTLNMKDRTVSMVVNAEDVSRLVGRLDDFTVFGPGLFLRCAGDLVVAHFPFPQTAEIGFEETEA